MTIGMTLLAVAAATVLAAILTNRQALLLLGIAGYVAVTIQLAYNDPVMLAPALVGAIALEMVGLRRVLRDGSEDVSVTSCHNTTRTVPNKMGPVGGV